MTKNQAKELADAIRACVRRSISSMTIENAIGAGPNYYESHRLQCQMQEQNAYTELERLLWSGEEEEQI